MLTAIYLVIVLLYVSINVQIGTLVYAFVFL